MAPAGATTKGLNQIVTPDIQPLGQLSLSYQFQDPNVGNREELQAELGITRRFEMAAFQGFSPSTQILNAEYGIIQNQGNQPWLLSTGFLNWSAKGGGPTPFLEGGFYQGPTQISFGALYAPETAADASGSTRQSHTTQVLLGYAYHVSSRLQVQADYQSGDENFATAGFTYSVTPALTFNPAAYVANSGDHTAYAYAVLTYTITAFK